MLPTVDKIKTVMYITINSTEAGAAILSITAILVWVKYFAFFFEVVLFIDIPNNLKLTFHISLSLFTAAVSMKRHRADLCTTVSCEDCLWFFYFLSPASNAFISTFCCLPRFFKFSIDSCTFRVQYRTI